MGLLRKLFGADGGHPPPASQSHLTSSVSKVPIGGAHTPGTHKELVAAAVRDTLARNGIPAAWITAETLVAKSRTGVMGVHLRLIVHHWDPRLMVRLVPLQNAVVMRLHRLDPVAETWLTGIAWQFHLADESACPALPHPGSWTAAPHEQEQAHAAPPSEAGVIEGPVEVARGERHDLERLMAEMDEAYRERAQGGGAFDATQPMDLKTQPGALRKN